MITAVMIFVAENVVYQTCIKMGWSATSFQFREGTVTPDVLADYSGFPKCGC
jgi:hypothetical protein